MAAVRYGVGDFVLDETAAHADDTGSAEELGVRGFVYAVTADVLDEGTGEVCDVLHVATSRHAQLERVDLPATMVERSFTASKVDAKRAAVLASRVIGQRKTRTPQWILDVHAAANTVMRSAPPVRDMPSPFPTDEENAAHDAASGGNGLLRRLQDSHDAHRDRSDRRAS